MIADYVCQRHSLEGTGLYIFRQQISKPYFNAVTVICTDNKRFRLNLSAFYFFNISIQTPVLFQFLFQYKEPPCGSCHPYSLYVIFA